VGRQRLTAHSVLSYRPPRLDRAPRSRNPDPERCHRGGSRRATEDPTATAALAWAAKYHVADVAVITSIEHWDLGSGESQVIAHCIGGSRWAVLDDRAARRCAAAHNVPVIGTLGIVLRSKQKRLIESARPLVSKLIATGMFLDDEFVDRVLASVRE